MLNLKANQLVEEKKRCYLPRFELRSDCSLNPDYKPKLRVDCFDSACWVANYFKHSLRQLLRAPLCLHVPNYRAEPVEFG